MLREFKPSLLFLARFLGVYLVGNVLYGAYIRAYGDHPDPATRVVTAQTSRVLNAMGQDTSWADNPFGAQVLLNDAGGTALRVFEGCNGLNVMIVFLAFLAAFGGPWKKMLWFVPAGLLAIHLINLARVALLYIVSVAFEDYFYLFHKYLFTAILYAAVFALWALWAWMNRTVTPRGILNTR